MTGEDPMQFNHARHATLIPLIVASLLLVAPIAQALGMTGSVAGQHGMRRVWEGTAFGRAMRSPFAEDRLSKSLHFAESDVLIGVVRARSVHEVGYGHKWDWEAKPLVAGGAEAGDCGGVVCAGLVGLDGCAALRRECEPGLQLAEALSRRPRCVGHADGSTIDPGSGHG
jgi:hypothetical protein